MGLHLLTVERKEQQRMMGPEGVSTAAIASILLFQFPNEYIRLGADSNCCVYFTIMTKQTSQQTEGDRPRILSN